MLLSAELDPKCQHLQRSSVQLVPVGRVDAVGSTNYYALSGGKNCFRRYKRSLTLKDDDDEKFDGCSVDDGGPGGRRCC